MTTNPQNYNRFSYVLNNPLKYTDPSGYNYIDPDGGTSYYIDGVKISGPMISLLFKNNHFLSNIYRFDYVRGNTDRNARNFSITFKNDLKFSSVNRAIGISIDWSETEKLSKEIEEQFHKFYKENDPSYTGEISIPQFHQLRQSAFFEFDELNNLIQEARRGRSGASASGGGGSSNPVQTASDVNNYTGIFISAADQVIKNTKFGSNIAYAISGNSNLVYAVNNGLRAAPYVGLGVTTYTGYNLSIQKNPATGQPYQTWLETGTDIGANIGIIYIGAQFGGWWGAGAAAVYLLDKAAFKAYIEECKKGTYEGIPKYRR